MKKNTLIIQRKKTLNLRDFPPQSSVKRPKQQLFLFVQSVSVHACRRRRDTCMEKFQNKILKAVVKDEIKIYTMTIFFCK